MKGGNGATIGSGITHSPTGEQTLEFIGCQALLNDRPESSGRGVNESNVEIERFFELVFRQDFVSRSVGDDSPLF